MSTQLVTKSISAAFFEGRATTQITWLGMAGAMLNARGNVLLIDPLLVTVSTDGQACSEAGYRLKLPMPIEAKHIPHADLVMITHADDDHLGRQTVQILASRTTCRFLAPAPVARILREVGIDPARIDIARDGESWRYGDNEVLVTPALHDWQTRNPWQRNDCCGFHVTTPDGIVWHPGDTRLIDELLAIKGVDVMFFDVAAVDAHLGPEGSAKLAVSCGAKVMIAYHYGTFDLPPGSFGSFDPQDALPYIRDLSAKFLLLNPGEVLELSNGSV